MYDLISLERAIIGQFSLGKPSITNIASIPQVIWDLQKGNSNRQLELKVKAKIPQVLMHFNMGGNTMQLLPYMKPAWASWIVTCLRLVYFVHLKFYLCPLLPCTVLLKDATGEKKATFYWFNTNTYEWSIPEGGLLYVLLSILITNLKCLSYLNPPMLLIQTSNDDACEGFCSSDTCEHRTPSDTYRHTALSGKKYYNLLLNISLLIKNTTTTKCH